MMSTDTPPTEVTEGLYYGFSSAELSEEKARYKAAVREFSKQREAAGGGAVTFISVNGKQVTMDVAKARAHLDEWRIALQNAEAELAGADHSYSDRTAIRFS